MADHTSPIGLGTVLHNGDTVTSTGGAAQLKFVNCNLVVKFNGQTTPLTSNPAANGTCTFASNGDLVIAITSGAMVWDSGTEGEDAQSLVVSDSGHVTIVTSGGTVLWEDGSKV